MKSEEEKPPSTAFKKLKNLISFKPKSLNEVSEVLQHALNTNIIDKEAQLIAEKAIRLGDTTLKEIMIPKVEMVTVDVNESQDVFINRIIESGHSRYPVMGENKNEVKGLLLAKDILPALHSKTPISLEKVTRNIKVVPENKKADTMLEEFKNDRSHMAVVIDEYGSVSGLITIEDVLEELVGEIEDEHDTGDVDELIQVSPTEYIADARLDINVFEKKFDLKFDDLDAETVGGLFIHKLGLLPKVGDRIEVNNMTLAVTAADKRKVKKIGITINKPTSD
ncbi:MAG: cobalt transporter [Gammaproteobacteria bacterium]|jgi:magnesium and cobalt transporter|nr:MAG: cobalt transporter [Gammaproteobacteria bacterium]|tara:strand:+ start:72 stop:911 length:840 start_codon:yes stop_codon:yes gene_type:complete